MNKNNKELISLYLMALFISFFMIYNCYNGNWVRSRLDTVMMGALVISPYVLPLWYYFDKNKRSVD